jgi:hypothetical protein
MLIDLPILNGVLLDTEAVQVAAELTGASAGNETTR